MKITKINIQSNDPLILRVEVNNKSGVFLSHWKAFHMKTDGVPRHEIPAYIDFVRSEIPNINNGKYIIQSTGHDSYKDMILKGFTPRGRKKGQKNKEKVEV